MPCTELAWAFVMISFYCEFSEMVCDEFEQFNEELHRYEWYLIPMEMQRIYLIFLLDTQQLTVVRGYGNILCTRVTFKAVIHRINGEHQ